MRFTKYSALGNDYLIIPAEGAACDCPALTEQFGSKALAL